MTAGGVDILQAIAQGQTAGIRAWVAQGGDANRRGTDGVPLWVSAILCDAADKEIGRIRALMDGGAINTDAVFPYAGQAGCGLADVLDDAVALVDDPAWIEAVEDALYAHRAATRARKHARYAQLGRGAQQVKGLKL